MAEILMDADRLLRLLPNIVPGVEDKDRHVNLRRVREQFYHRLEETRASLAKESGIQIAGLDDAIAAIGHMELELKMREEIDAQLDPDSPTDPIWDEIVLSSKKISHDTDSLVTLVNSHCNEISICLEMLNQAKSESLASEENQTPLFQRIRQIRNYWADGNQTDDILNRIRAEADASEMLVPGKPMDATAPMEERVPMQTLESSHSFYLSATGSPLATDLDEEEENEDEELLDSRAISIAEEPGTAGAPSDADIAALANAMVSTDEKIHPPESIPTSRPSETPRLPFPQFPGVEEDDESDDESFDWKRSDVAQEASVLPELDSRQAPSRNLDDVAPLHSNRGELVLPAPAEETDTTTGELVLERQPFQSSFMKRMNEAFPVDFWDNLEGDMGDSQDHGGFRMLSQKSADILRQAKEQGYLDPLESFSDLASIIYDASRQGSALVPADIHEPVSDSETEDRDLEQRAESNFPSDGKLSAVTEPEEANPLSGQDHEPIVRNVLKPRTFNDSRSSRGLSYARRAGLFRSGMRIPSPRRSPGRRYTSRSSLDISGLSPDDVEGESFVEPRIGFMARLRMMFSREGPGSSRAMSDSAQPRSGSLRGSYLGRQSQAPRTRPAREEF
uniref:Uncharacterized protein n=1 Tax=Compsopogon caeruleus TaxID=31354 RepID=A0A7S1XFK3_9RHOD